MDRWGRLGKEIRRARRSRGFRTLEDFSTRAGIKPRTLSDLERGARSNFSPETLGAVEDALGWVPGSVQTILTGGQPQPAHDEDLVAIINIWPEIDYAGRRAVRTLAEEFARPRR